MKSQFLIPFFLSVLILVSCKIPATQKYEGRAIWVTRYEYSRDKTAAESRQYIRDLFEKARKAKFNMIVFQVRGNGDAYYRSTIEPWGESLTGKMGEDPGWDPLAYAVETAHQLGLELHAWVNTFPAWHADAEAPPDTTEPLHPLLQHPEWVVCDANGNPMKPNAGYISFSPGIPEVQEHIINVVCEITKNYDVDGIHFDYIRYPEGSPDFGYSHDSVSVARFNSPEGNPANLDWASWQREQVNIFITGAYNAITGLKPWVKVSAAVIGSHHVARWNGYRVVYQDPRRWIATGKIDIIFPMTYTWIDHPTVPYAQSLDEWKAMQYLGRTIMPGIPVYQVERHFNWKMIWKQIQMVREYNFGGMIFFSARRMPDGFPRLEDVEYANWALTPPMPWKLVPEPAVPQNLSAALNADGRLQLRWEASPFSKSNQYYVIYRCPTENIDIRQAANICAVIPGSVNQYTVDLKKGQDYYCITAVNKAGIESTPGETIWVNGKEALVYKKTAGM